MIDEDCYCGVCVELRRNKYEPDLDVTMPEQEIHPLSQAFLDILDEAAAVHLKKQKDYGRVEDPFANVRASEDFGVPGWLGCMIRGNDKMRRLQAYAINGTLANEGVEDALMDLLVYCGIGLALYREQNGE